MKMIKKLFAYAIVAVIPLSTVFCADNAELQKKEAQLETWQVYQVLKDFIKAEVKREFEEAYKSQKDEEIALLKKKVHKYKKKYLDLKNNSAEKEKEMKVSLADNFKKEWNKFKSDHKKINPSNPIITASFDNNMQKLLDNFINISITGPVNVNADATAVKLSATGAGITK